jgi:SAM-dependent methyltransferase
VSWKLFEAAASTYEGWYATRRGQRADQAERALLAWLLRSFPNVCDVLEIGCGTGHFTEWFAASRLRTLGLDRAWLMLAELHRRFAHIPVVHGDAHRLPLRAAAVDVALFVTTLEFLEDPHTALSEAVRVARRGVVVVALNRWSVGGLSRRCGPQAHGTLLGRARDYSVASLRTMLAAAAGERLRDIRWASTLFPDGMWKLRVQLPLGDVIGMAAILATPVGGLSVAMPRASRGAFLTMRFSPLNRLAELRSPRSLRRIYGELTMGADRAGKG